MIRDKAEQSLNYGKDRRQLYAYFFQWVADPGELIPAVVCADLWCDRIAIIETLKPFETIPVHVDTYQPEVSFCEDGGS